MTIIAGQAKPNQVERPPQVLTVSSAGAEYPTVSAALTHAATLGGIPVLIDVAPVYRRVG